MLGLNEMHSPSLGVILPAHNSELNLEKSLLELAEWFLSRQCTGQVIVVENGSTDNTWKVVNELSRADYPFTMVVTQSAKGLGNAIRAGLSLLTTEIVLITADDLPFGFTDIEGYLSLKNPPPIAVGSKAHSLTRGSRSLSREMMSSGFRLLRRLILDLNLGDTQGSILGNAQEIKRCAADTHQANYLMTTELLAYANLRNLRIIELPVSFREQTRASNVNVISDSLAMLRGLFEVRKALRSSLS